MTNDIVSTINAAHRNYNNPNTALSAYRTLCAL